jgi:hypothetical protein
MTTAAVSGKYISSFKSTHAVGLFSDILSIIHSCGLTIIVMVQLHLVVNAIGIA